MLTILVFNCLRFDNLFNARLYYLYANFLVRHRLEVLTSVLINSFVFFDYAYSSLSLSRGARQLLKVNRLYCFVLHV